MENTLSHRLDRCSLVHWVGRFVTGGSNNWKRTVISLGPRNGTYLGNASGTHLVDSSRACHAGGLDGERQRIPNKKLDWIHCKPSFIIHSYFNQSRSDRSKTHPT